MALGALVGWLARRRWDRPARRRDRRHPARRVAVVYQVYAGADAVSAGIFSTPRPVPSRLAPALAGTAVDRARAARSSSSPAGRCAGWVARGRPLGRRRRRSPRLLTRLPLGPGNLAAAGMRGIGTTFRAMAVGIPLVVVTVADERVGIAAALLYALAFTVELARRRSSTYFGAGGARHEARSLGLAVSLCARRCRRSRSRRRGGRAEEETFDPSHEWKLHDVGADPIGPIDMSINKAVAYLMLGTRRHAA